jgi:hypothetical protein
MFETSPTSARLLPSATAMRIYNQDSLVVLAPSELRFAVAPGSHTVRGEFGLNLPASSWADSDGVRFTIGVGDSAPLLEVLLTPRDVPVYRGRQTFDLAFEAEPGSQLWLRTDPGPNGDSTADLAYWRAVAVDSPRRGGATTDDESGAPPAGDRGSARHRAKKRNPTDRH